MKTALKKTSLLIFVSILLLSGCISLDYVYGSDDVVETEYPFKDFNTVDISHSFSTKIIQSDSYKVIIQYNDNLKEHLNISSHNGVLEIGLLHGHNYKNTKLSATIYLPHLEGIKASGASSINIPKFSASHMEMELSGASDVYAQLHLTHHLNIEASGASDIRLEGSAQNANLSFSGATELSGKDMTIDNNLTIDCSGASALELTVNGEISIDISGASSFKYYGKGAIVKSDVSGSSSIHKK